MLRFMGILPENREDYTGRIEELYELLSETAKELKFYGEDKKEAEMIIKNIWEGF